MLRWFNPAYISAGLVAVLVGFTSSAAIIFSALQSLSADVGIVDSWFLVLGLGMGFSTLGLSLYYKQPILTAWSTPGAAIMVTGLNGMSVDVAVGAFIFSSAMLVLVGLSGVFNKLVKVIPNSIAGALLAGVLTPFALNALQSFESNLTLGLVMLGGFIVSHVLLPRYSVLMTLVLGILVVVARDQGPPIPFNLTFASPVWVTPSFSWAAIISLGIPLFVVTMASQNLPGVAALRAANYQAPASPLVGWTGFTGLITAPFGGFAFNLAAITAAICMTEEVDPDPKQRFRASVWAGIFYVLLGLFASSITALFFAVPEALVMIIAGLALMGTIGSSLYMALADVQQRLPAMITFVTTASGIAIGGIGSAFWGLAFGLTMIGIMQLRQKKG